MNQNILRLIDLLKIYNGGSISQLLEDELKVFADYDSYQLETIHDLVEAMESEMSYWEN